MTIQSMTGFGRAELASENYNVTIEIKSVNNRYKDFRFKIPSVFNCIESRMKDILLDSIKRGSVDVYINFKKDGTNSGFGNLDFNKINEFVRLFQDFEKQINPHDFLRSDFYKDEDFANDEELLDLTLDTLKLATKELVKSRTVEGNKLKNNIYAHIANYCKYYQQVPEYMKDMQDNIAEKLKKRMKDFDDLKIDEPRFLQEIVYYMEKLDIDEEINRIAAHIEKLNKLLNDGGEVGRQIDFLMQELNRETNTIGSKSSVKEVSNFVVQMKVQLEKIREQGLNLE